MRDPGPPFFDEEEEVAVGGRGRASAPARVSLMKLHRSLPCGEGSGEYSLRHPGEEMLPPLPPLPLPGPPTPLASSEPAMGGKCRPMI